MITCGKLSIWVYLAWMRHYNRKYHKWITGASNDYHTWKRNIAIDPLLTVMNDLLQIKIVAWSKWLPICEQYFQCFMLQIHFFVFWLQFHEVCSLQIDDRWTLVWTMAWHWRVDKPLLNQCWLSSMTPNDLKQSMTPNDLKQSYSDDSRLAPSRCETSLRSNAVSHWLGANLESTLITCITNVVSKLSALLSGLHVSTHLPLVPHVCVSELS